MFYCTSKLNHIYLNISVYVYIVICEQMLMDQSQRKFHIFNEKNKIFFFLLEHDRFNFILRNMLKHYIVQ